MRVSPLFLFAAAWVLSRMASPAGQATLPGGAKAKGKWTKAELVSLAWDAGFPEDETNTAAAVAMAESGGNPDALNVGPKERSVGLWQINLRAHKSYSEADMRDPSKNAAAAFAIWSMGSSWKPWGAYTNGAYKQYLLSAVQSIDTSSACIHTGHMTTSTRSTRTDANGNRLSPQDARRLASRELDAKLAVKADVVRLTPDDRAVMAAAAAAARARTASIPRKYKVKKHSGVRTRPAICLTLSDEDVRRLDVVARAEGVSRSRLISSLSRFCFERHFGKVTSLDAAEAEFPEET